MKLFIIIITCLLFQGCVAQDYCKPIEKTNDALNVKTTLIKWKENNEITQPMMEEDDIDGWDIPIDQIKTVCVDEFGLNIQPYYFSKEDGIRLIKAFNTIQKKDIIDEVPAGHLYGGFLSRIVVTLKSGEKIMIGYDPTCILAYGDMFYYTSYQLVYYDVVRELNQKCTFRYLDWETEYLNNLNGYGSGWENHLIVAPDKTINETRTALGLSATENQDYTFNDL